MTDNEKAKSLLSPPKCTCAFVCRDGSVVKSGGRGITPLLSAVTSEGTRILGSAAADTIVGKAAAMLHCRAQVNTLWAGVITHEALALLTAYGTRVEYGELVEHIQNRAKTDSCPLEKLVADTEDLNEGLKIITEFAASLAK